MVVQVRLKILLISLQVDSDGNLLYTNVLETRTATTPIYSPRTTETKIGSILTRFPTREPYPDHEAQSIENATVVDENVTEKDIDDAKQTYKETKTATENEMKSVLEKVNVQSDVTETYNALVDEVVGGITEELKTVTKEIKELLTKNSKLLPELDLTDPNKKKAFDDLLFINEDLQKNIVLPNLKAKDLLIKHSPQSVTESTKKIISDGTDAFNNFKDA